MICPRCGFHELEPPKRICWLCVKKAERRRCADYYRRNNPDCRKPYPEECVRWRELELIRSQLGGPGNVGCSLRCAPIQLNGKNRRTGFIFPIVIGEGNGFYVC